MPAVNVWIGASDSFNTAANWTDGVPTADDTLVFTGPTSPPPGPPGPPLPPQYSNHNVNFPTTSNLSFSAIEIKDGYSGSIYFPANISFGGYTQTTGATEQNFDTTLTVTSTFNWTGGVVNNSSNTATYKLAGVPLGEIGTDDTTLSSGSKIVLDKNSGGRVAALPGIEEHPVG